MTGLRLWHGGYPGLKPGELLTGGHDRATHPDCQFCQDRRAAYATGTTSLIDAPSLHTDRVYLTTSREYARHYASLYGRGDLYRVEPVGELIASTEDTMPTWSAPAARVIAVYARAVTLTMTQRRRLFREWGQADRRVAAQGLTRE